MKSKILILLVGLFFLSGCEAVYNIELTNNGIKDELNINNYDVSSWNTGSPTYKTLIDNNYKDFNLAVDKNTPGYPEVYRKLPGYDYYNKVLINDSNNYGIKFSYNHNFNSYSKSPLLDFYNNISIKNNMNSLIIDTGDSSGCYLFDNYKLMDKLTINIKSNYVVSKHNADNVKDNLYTWIITKDNYKNKTVHIEVDKSHSISSIKTHKEFNKIITISLICIAIITSIFVLLTFIKVIKSNK